MVYGREVRGQTLTFGVSGKLWRNSLIMYDRETGSEWSQVSGHAISGPLRGARLEKLVATGRSDTFALWRARFPHLKVLKERGLTTAGGDTYASYHRGTEAGVRPVENQDSRLPAKQRVVGVEVGPWTYAVPVKFLGNGKPRAFSCPAGPVELLSDDAGIHIRRSPPGHRAEALKVYWFVWSDFHPGTRVLDANDLAPVD